jgi:hypothetical protein
MVNKINNTIQNKIYAYNPNEFLPIFVDGRLDNRDQFIAYKAKCVGRVLGSAIQKGYELTYSALDR